MAPIRKREPRKRSCRSHPAILIEWPIDALGLVEHCGGQMIATATPTITTKASTVHSHLLDRCWTRGEGGLLSD